MVGFFHRNGTTFAARYDIERWRAGRSDSVVIVQTDALRHSARSAVRPLFSNLREFSVVGRPWGTYPSADVSRKYAKVHTTELLLKTIVVADFTMTLRRTFCVPYLAWISISNLWYRYDHCYSFPVSVGLGEIGSRLMCLCRVACRRASRSTCTPMPCLWRRGRAAPQQTRRPACRYTAGRRREARRNGARTATTPADV